MLKLTLITQDTHERLTLIVHKDNVMHTRPIELSFVNDGNKGK